MIVAICGHGHCHAAFLQCDWRQSPITKYLWDVSNYKHILYYVLLSTLVCHAACSHAIYCTWSNTAATSR